MSNDGKVPFGELEYLQRFRARGTDYQRVVKAKDNLGGYNAREMETGRRDLFFMHEEVEVPDDDQG